MVSVVLTTAAAVVVVVVVNLPGPREVIGEDRPGMDVIVVVVVDRAGEVEAEEDEEDENDSLLSFSSSPETGVLI